MSKIQNSAWAQRRNPELLAQGRKGLVWMRGLLAMLLFLHLGHPLEATCPPDNPNNLTSSLGVLNWEGLEPSRTCVNISGQNITEITGIPSQGRSLKELDLSHNSLGSLPDGLLNNTGGLEHLFLQNSGLHELPPALFENADHLKELRLEGNPRLPSVPATLFRLCLETLSVDCRCDVAESISSYCQRLNCTPSISCLCSSPRGFLNVTDFYAQQCRGLSVAMYAAIVISVLAVLLGAAVACVLIRRKKRGAAVQEKRESRTSNGAQPRYISHAGLQANPAQGLGAHADYENVFIGQPQEADRGHMARNSSKQPKSRSHRKVQKANASPPGGEQPIYANAQEVYYNYVETPAPLDEDLYVMPDQ
uniref:leucine-rich repeat-containing protein 25-like n=1 Tax=Euleptes europaea TaxID=460621 RepID=UPI002541BF63|nr:leucine-rich repeat-containing protein 25-like [Euleptes europaea]